MDRETPSSDAAALPAQIGPFRIVGELGRGGMGVVLRALDPELGRAVAVKVLPPGAESETRMRFLREGRTAARLRHPGIVTVHGAGEADGYCWIAQELVEGESLAVHLGREPLPPLQAAGVIEGVARALAHAHAEGVVHRDVKPGNVVLDADGAPHLRDFGLARDVAGTQRLSQSGTIIGTPEYMAPEQAEGRLGAIDARTDVWACGATLYECLAGRPPFVAEGLLAVVTAVVNDDPAPLREHAPDTPRGLERIVSTCLQKRPERRYPTAQALAEDLARFQRGEPVRGSEVGRVTRWGDWVQRHRAVAGAGGVVALLCAVLGAWWTVATLNARAAVAEQFRIATALVPEAPAQALGLLQALAAQHPDWPGLRAALAEAETTRVRVEQERRRAPARVLLATAQRHLAAHHTCDQQLADLCAQSAEFVAAQQSSIDRLLRDRDAAYAGARAGWLAVRELLLDDRAAPERTQAMQSLAELARARWLDAAWRQEVTAAARYAADFQTAADGTAPLPTTARLSLTTLPAGATIEVFRYSGADGRLDPEPVATLPAPLEGWPLDPGSYRLRIRHPERAETLWPCRVVAGDELAVTLPLLAATDLGADWVYVPAGHSVLGGDPTADGALPWRRVAVPGFCISRHEVTVGQYREFLAAIAASDGPKMALGLAPQDSRWKFWPDGRVDVEIALDEPVMRLTHAQAQAYCAWRSARDGVPVRLPTETEWERAARGADGRVYPWGARFSWDLVVGGESTHRGQTGAPHPVGTAAGDVSPFGVHDLAGSAKEFCAGWLDGDHRKRAVRGGAFPYRDPRAFRAATREGYEPDSTGRTGFRIARDLPR